MGLDQGWASLTVTRDGVKMAPPMLLRGAFKGMRLQRRLSRKAKGTNNRTVARLRRAVAHATVTGQRLNHFHKLSTGPVREHQMVCFEGLSGTGMVKNRKPARSMADAGWHLLKTLLASKARMDGRVVQVVSRWQPTSRTCSECGHRDGKKDVSVRWWRCPACGAEQDHDGNAARTILAAAGAARGNAGGAESRSGWPPPGCEAGTHLMNEQVQRWIA